MRITIVPIDGVVTIDGVSRSNINLSFLDPTIHAIQWYNTWGEVEYKDPVTNKMTSNVHITDISMFQQAIDLYNAAIILETTSEETVVF